MEGGIYFPLFFLRLPEEESQRPGVWAKKKVDGNFSHSDNFVRLYIVIPSTHSFDKIFPKNRQNSHKLPK